MSTEMFHVFGDLEFAVKDVTDKKSLRKLREFAPFLERLEQSDLEEQEASYDYRTQPALFDYRTSFDEFQKAEVATWPEGSRYEKFEQELVRPSGNIDARISNHLHYPSFTTKHRYDGEIADDTNCCIRLVLKKGFNIGNSFMFNTFSRREGRDKLKDYSRETEDVHRGWSNRLHRAMTAKVEIVWGAASRQWMEENLDLVQLKLFGPWKGVTLHLERSPANENIERIIVFVHHPEYFLHQYDAGIARRQDRALNAAAALAGVRVDENFFERRAKFLERPFDQIIEDEDDENEGELRSPSARKLHFVLMDLLEAEAENEGFQYDWLPYRVTSWLSDSYDITDQDGLHKKWKSIFGDGEDSESEPGTDMAELEASESSLVGKIFSLYGRKGGMAQLRGRSRDEHGNVFSVMDPYVIPYPNRTMERKCHRCGRGMEADTYVRYGKTHPTYYVAHGHKGCHNRSCEGRRCWAIPVDDSIPWQAGQLDMLQLENPTDRGKIPEYAKHIANGSTFGKPDVVPVRCIGCGTIGANDEEAAYTREPPHVYHARDRTCPACKKQLTFVPTDGGDYVTRKGLWSWEHNKEMPLDKYTTSQGSKSNPPAKRSGFEHWIASGEEFGLPTAVQLKCSVCGTTGKVNKKAKYLKEVPHLYHAGPRICDTCGKARRLFVPADDQGYVDSDTLMKWDREVKKSSTKTDAAENIVQKDQQSRKRRRN
ncbi:MAG: hypothetical protein M1819_001180 [Sarea resinae]|nr:MAG: hypothetical protein M1819_001180 [Sarea resinae]